MYICNTKEHRPGGFPGTKKSKAMKTQELNISDFYFRQLSYGRYEVTYTDPDTYEEYTMETTDMQLIDETKNEDDPSLESLEDLKSRCMNY